MRMTHAATSLTIATVTLLCASLLPRATTYGAGLSHRPACPPAVQGKVRCLAQVVTDDLGTPLASNSPLPGAYGPAQFHAAYNLPCSINGKKAQAICPTPSRSGGQTIALVDAGSDPNIETDLNTYDQVYGLPACTTSNGCLTIINE